MGISSIRHPSCEPANWVKWRLTYEGGKKFVNRYLVKFSNREDTADFRERKAITYSPSFAKAAVNEVKNAIFQRIGDVTRVGGPSSFTDAVKGESGGVDRSGSTMASFIGRDVLPELLSMGRVGIFVDRESAPETLTKATKLKNPYLYTYRVEDILSWVESENANEYDAVLLKHTTNIADPETGLPIGQIDVIRHIYKENGQIVVREYSDDSKFTEQTLKLTKIPFVMLKISESLLKDIADHQIALLNAESSDISYILKSNYPFYVEQVDNKTRGDHLKTTDEPEEAGVHNGRRYPIGANQPDFISPPTEPIDASMRKQAQIKADIRLLINLSITNLQPTTMASADSKRQDDKSLEAGLSYIGLELEQAEQQISTIWAEYEGTSEKTVIRYPQRYSMKSDEDILKEAKELEDRMKAIPSNVYKREVAKQIAFKMLGSKVTFNTLEQIYSEIDKTKILTTDPDLIFQSIDRNIISNEDAAIALGLPDDPASLEQAAQDHADRAKRVAEAQASVQHSNSVDTSNNLTDAAKEKANAASKKASLT